MRRILAEFQRVWEAGMGWVSFCGRMAWLQNRDVFASGFQAVALAALLTFLTAVNLQGAASSGLTETASDRPWQITSYAVEAGLGGQRVFDIAFEPDGTAWLAAADGLRRYDGFTWERFDTNSSLPSTFARAVEVTRAGELWVGSDAGAGVFNFKKRTYDPRGSLTGLANSNVRQIVEDPDGTLWFSCDQWPETSEKNGGLTQWRDGVWKTYGRAEGIPMDYVIGYFRDSKVRQFALTPRGWSQWQDGKWSVPANPGYEVEPCVLHLAEAGDGTVFAQGERTLLQLARQRWRVVSKETVLVGATRSGEVIAVSRDDARGLLWFSVWDGQQFVRASASVSCLPGARLYRLREAPDGSVWCVGHGTVARWVRGAGSWTLYPNLPRPFAAAANEDVWFADGTNVVALKDGAFQQLPWRRLLAINRAGTAIGLSGGAGELAVTNLSTAAAYPVGDVALKDVKGANADAADGFWLTGLGGADETAIVHLNTNRARLIPAAQFKDKYISNLTPDPDRGLWVVAQSKENMRYELGYIVNGNVQWIAPESPLPPLTYPNLAIGAGMSWIRGYAALYQGPLAATGPWEQVTAFPDTSFESALASPDEMLFTFSGGRTGKPGCALYTHTGWKVVYGDFTRAGRGENGVIYLSSRGGCHIRRVPGTLELDYLPVPADTFVSSIVPGREGTLWVGTAEGVLHYQPARTPPDTTIESSATEVRRDGALQVAFAGLRRFAIAPAPAAYRYSWRFDAGEWTPFERMATPTLTFANLKPGAHRLEARARDVDGNVDPSPAVFQFTVLPMPLQQRPWFAWVVGLVVLVIGGLTRLGIQRTRQIARSNAALREEIAVRQQTEAALQKAREELEHRVAERTRELVQANESLSREIVERQQAEKMQLRLEEELRQSQKMEAVGTLAGGIAHDFNNILAVIIPFGHFALEESAGRPQMQEYLRQILAAADRAKNLVQQVLAFSRRQRQERQILDPQPIVQEALKLLRSALPSTIEIVPRFSDTPPVLADPTQIHQVVMNLCTNAEYAMRGRPGRLEIELGPVTVDEVLAGQHPELRPGRYVRLCVRDNGSGMPPELLTRVFEPFFTTKEPGQGTGLGLSVVHGIVKSHDGVILVRSEPDRGTEFQIFLPAQSPSTVPLPPETKPASARGAGQRILLVDDEPSITNAVGRLLSQAGYRVTLQTDSQEAWRTFRARPAEFDLLFTDLTMPGMTGAELAKRVFELRPELPVILTTGFGGDAVADSMKDTNIRKVLQKPLSPRGVTDAIHESLQKPPQG